MNLSPMLPAAGKSPVHGILALAVVVASGALARGETVHLRGGERLIGKIVTNTVEKVVVESQVLGTVEIPRERIERIDPARPGKDPGISPEAAFHPIPKEIIQTVPLSLTDAATGFEPRKNESSTDWIQLKSGEWLRGTLHGMQNRKMEFESDELDDLTLDWKDVHQVWAPRALVSYANRESAWGSVYVDRETVTVTGVEEVQFPRYDLVGIAPGSPRELDYWSGRINVGLNLRAGNTEQADLVTKMKVDRRTPSTHFRVEYVGNYSELDGVENVNNQRVNQFFDVFLTRRWFVRVPQSEYYRDPFQNIDRRFTAGGGVGYYLIDRPKIEWLVSGGPAYQYIRFDTVQLGEPEDSSTPAFFLQSRFEIEVTRRTDLEIAYQLIAANQDAGGLTHHATATIEIDLTRRLDLDLTFVWDRIGDPQTDATGAVPENNDYRLNLSLGVKF